MAYIGVQPTDTYLSIASQQITGTGSATYTLNYSVSNEEDVAVFVNNVRQNVSSYTVSGDQLTLGGTISASDSCWVLFLGRTVGTKTPAVGSVTNDMLAGSIANSKLANSSITLNGSAVSLGGSATVANSPMFLAYAGSNVNVSSGTNTQVQLNSELYDTDNGFNTSTYRYTVQEAGYYFLFYHYRWETATDFDDQKVWVSYNSSVYTSDNIMSSWGANHYYTKMGTYEIRQLASGDTLDLFSYQSSGATRTLAGGDDFGLNTVFGGYKLLI